MHLQTCHLIMCNSIQNWIQLTRFCLTPSLPIHRISNIFIIHVGISGLFKYCLASKHHQSLRQLGRLRIYERLAPLEFWHYNLLSAVKYYVCDICLESSYVPLALPFPLYFLRSRISLRGYAVSPSGTHKLKSRNWAILSIVMVQEDIEHESMTN